jgi:hypothetical protein
MRTPVYAVAGAAIMRFREAFAAHNVAAMEDSEGRVAWTVELEADVAYGAISVLNLLQDVAENG